MGLLARIAGAFSGRQAPNVVEMPHGRPVRAAFDLVQTSDDNLYDWIRADALDADSSHSVTVRAKAVQRSRAECGNNGYIKGITRTHANYLVGRGPKLRMQTNSPTFNKMVVDAWVSWCKAVKLPRKLRTAVKAKVTDGEAFLIARANPNIRDRVALDIVGIECEQCTSPKLAYATKNRVDGIWFDDYGNPTHYDILPYHPGGSWWPGVGQDAEKVPANLVFHLFMQERPGQHRAIPELSSTLSTVAQSRKWRNAALKAAENIANISLYAKTKADPDTGPGQLAPFDTLEIQKGMIVALPSDGDIAQPKAEQPTATYGEFLRAQVSEQARPLSMAYTLAGCDSSNSNFASAKLDSIPYDVQLDVDNSEIEDLVLDPLFELWFELAVEAYGWNQAASPVPSHTWDWPTLPAIDEVKTATSRQIDLSTGVKSLSRIHSEDGYNFDEELAAMAQDYGVSVDEMRRKLFETNFRAGFAAAAKEEEPAQKTTNQVNRVAQYTGNGNGRPRV